MIRTLKNCRISLSIFIPAALAVLLTNPVGNFPLNDDWQYAFPVKTLVEQNLLEFKGIFAPNVLLQIGWGYLFCKLAGGFDFTWLRLSTLAAAAIAMLAFYRLGRKSGIGNSALNFSANMLIFNPLFYSLAFTFMSDVPFLALCLLSLLAFFKHLENGKIRWLVLACLWAIGSFYIRQPGIILLPVFAVFLLFQNGFSLKQTGVTVALFVLAAVVFFSLENWVKPALGISGNYVPVSGLYSEALLENPLQTAAEWSKKLVKTFIYLGFFAIPFLPFFWQKMRQLRLFSPKFLLPNLALNLLLLLFLVKTDKVFPFGGNVLFNFGLGPELLADVYTLGLPNTPKLPEWVMLGFNLAGQVSATLLFLLVFKCFPAICPTRRRFVWLLLLLNAVYLPLMSVTSFFDRYLLLPIASFFFLLAFFLEEENLKKISWRWLPLVTMCLFSVAATRDYLSWNRARHSAFGYLTEQGVSIKNIDAGYEYNGFYNYYGDRQEVAGRSFWWVDDDTWLISFGLVPGYEAVKSFPYRRWLFFKDDAIHVLKRK